MRWRGVGMRPVEFHSRCRERRSSSHRAVLSYASRVTGCHAQESLSPRFWLSGRVIVRVTSRRRNGEGWIYTSISASRCEAGCTRLFRCFSLLREDERERERERKRERGGGGKEGDRLFRLSTVCTLSFLTNWSCRQWVTSLIDKTLFFAPLQYNPRMTYRLIFQSNQCLHAKARIKYQLFLKVTFMVGWQ